VSRHEPLEAVVLRNELAERNAGHETEFYVLVNEAQALDLASGYVPQAVKAMVNTMLDFRDEDRRRAARPEPKTVKKGRR
jgi:hypothetical protein